MKNERHRTLAQTKPHHHDACRDTANRCRAGVGFVLFHQDLPTTLRPKIRASADERSIYSGRHHVGNPTITAYPIPLQTTHQTTY